VVPIVLSHGCAPDEIDSFIFAFSAWLPACVPAYVMRIPCSLICAAFGLGFGRSTIVIAATDDSYTNLIAPYQRVQAVSWRVYLYFLLLLHWRRFRCHLLAGACLAASLVSCEFHADQTMLH